jgi:enediyne biosynthesis protein CalE5
MQGNVTRSLPDTSPGREEARRKLHAMWAGVAAAWEANAAFVEARGRQVSERMLELASPRPGERLLELACGVGGPGLQAAPLLLPGGEVVISDVAEEMTASAAARSDRLGLENVSARTLDLEAIDEPDSSFDIALCREGLMLVGDPARALAEIRRVLRPGGRIVLSVWGPRAENPWLAVVFDAVSEQLGVTMPPPGAPHPLSLGDRDRLEALLSEAAFAEVSVGELPTPYRAADAEEWWRRTSVLAGPLARKLAALPEDVAAELRSRAIAAITPYETPSGLEIPGLSLVAAAYRAP